jgi:putative GTP pyrophosphokinase
MTKRARAKPARRLVAARNWYDKNLPLHQRLAEKVKTILEELLRVGGIQVHRVEARVKTEKSFLGKAGKKRGGKPKYADPPNEITDLVGVRVITYFDSTVKEVCGLVEKEFEVDP